MSDDPSSFSYQGITINYYEKGTGKTMLLLHGFGASSYSWRHVRRAFSASYRIITFDLKGFGLSDKPLDESYGIEHQSDIILAFIKAHHLKDITLVGHSYGGAVALITAVKLMESGRENLLKEMVLIDSAAYPQTFPYFISMLRVPLVNNLALRLIPNKLNVHTLLKKVFYDHLKITQDIIDSYANCLSLPGAYHSLISTAKQILPKNMHQLTDSYKSIKAPVLLIWGAHDSIVPLSVGQKLSENLPNARLQIIPNCGHAPQEECPDETITVIKNFLAEPDQK